MAPVARWCKLGCAFVMSLSSVAHAQTKTDRTSSLSWVRLEGAESCIATQALARAVEERLGRKVFVSASEADVSVEGHLSRSETPPRWRAVLTIRDARGELLGTRELDSDAPQCSDFDEALVFVVSVMIDPEAETRSSEPAAPAPAPAPPVPAAAPARVVVKRERVLVPVPPREPPDPWRVELGASVRLGLGLLPDPSVGIGADAIVDPPSFWGVLLTASYWFPQAVDAERAAEGEVALAYGGAAICPLTWRDGPTSFRTCAGALLGSLRSRGVGFDTELTNETFAAFAFVPNRLSVRLAAPLQAFATVTLMVPLAKTELTYRSADGTSRVLFDPAPVALSAGAGLSLAFP